MSVEFNQIELRSTMSSTAHENKIPLTVYVILPSL